MQNQSPPFRADTVGSLLRSKRLLDARADKQDGRISDAELRKIEDEEVARAVALQKDVGLKCCTAGDFRRRHWFMDFLERIDGLRFAGPGAGGFKGGDGSGGRGTPSDAEDDIELVISESPDDVGPGGSGALVMCAVLWLACYICLYFGLALVSC